MKRKTRGNYRCRILWGFNWYCPRGVGKPLLSLLMGVFVMDSWDISVPMRLRVIELNGLLERHSKNCVKRMNVILSHAEPVSASLVSFRS